MNFVAVDTETTGLDAFDPKVVMLCTSLWSDQGKGAVIRHEHEKRHKGLQDLLLSDTVKLFWNAKFDIRILRKSGYEINDRWIDANNAARIAITDADEYDLKSWARHYLKDSYREEVELKKFIRKNKINKATEGFRRVPDRILYPYALKDSQCTLELWFMIWNCLKEKKLLPVFRFEAKVLRASMEMEEYGMDLDPKTVHAQHRLIEAQAQERLNKLREMAGNPTFNPGSNQQLAPFVYNGEAMPTRFSRKTGKISCNEVALLEAATERAVAVLGWRKLTTALKTYYRPFASFLASGRGVTLHPSLNSMGALTGRFSSSGPNLQNQPRPGEHPKWGGALGSIRSCWRARPGYWFLFADYEQIEMRLTAHFTGEEHMLDAIRHGKDLHDEAAKRIFKIDKDHKEWKRYRYLAKTLNFAVIYGVQADTFSQTVLKQSGIPISWAESHQYLEEYRAEHPGVVGYFELVEQEVQQTGGIRNAFGRYISVSDRKTYPGVNYHIQSTAADVMKRALLRCHNFLKQQQCKSRLIMTVHDELIFEIHETEQHLVRPLVALIPVMDEFSVPLTCSVSYGRSWGNKKELKL